MPSLQALADEGVYFDNVYSTGTRTTRGLEAILHGYPPLPGIAVNQREGLEKLPSLPRQLRAKGFNNLFVYGGWPEFSKFSTYWKRIGYDKIFTREDFAEDLFATSWGVADENLFEKILQEMDTEAAQGGNIFLSTLTVSNHRPFDVPAGRIPYPNERKLEYAIAYADWALGDFFAKQKRSPGLPKHCLSLLRIMAQGFMATRQYLLKVIGYPLYFSRKILSRARIAR